MFSHWLKSMLSIIENSIKNFSILYYLNICRLFYSRYYKWDIWQTVIRKRRNTRTFKVRSIVAGFINLCERKRRPPARSLARERAPSSITLPRIWKFHPRNALNAFTCPNFRWQSAVHVHTSACRECSQFVGIFSSVCRSTRRGSLHGCSNCRLDPGHLFSTPGPDLFLQKSQLTQRQYFTNTFSAIYSAIYVSRFFFATAMQTNEMKSCIVNDRR